MKTEEGKELTYLMRKLSCVIDTYQEVIQDLKEIIAKKEQLEDIQRPFKDGDIVYEKPSGVGMGNIAIYKNRDSTYCHLHVKDNMVYSWGVPVGDFSVHATEAQKQLLFDRLAKDKLRWNEGTRKMEELNEPKVGDDCIFWDNDNENNWHIAKLQSIDKFKSYKYESSNTITNNCVKWDGTKEQFDNVRKGIIK
jgi:hypothetical protein